MKVGVPTEIKPDEYRVSLTPAGARELADHGHDVIVQAGAGEGSAITDADYEAQGARILPDAEAVFGEAEMVLGVKEPQPQEVAMLRPDHLLFTYLHLAPDPELTRGLCESGATCVAYETVEDADGPAAAAGAHERGGGQDRHPGRRVHAREADGRPRAAAGRRARRGGRQGAGHRRRRGGHERRHDRHRHAGRDLRVRPQPRPPARAGEHPELARVHGVRLHAGDRAAPGRRRPGDRRGAGARRQGAARGHARAAEADEAQRGAGGRVDRPGRLLRDQPADHPLRPHLRGRRHHPLLRGQHARRGADHLDLRADQRDAAVRDRPGRPRPARRDRHAARAWRPA